MGVLGAFFGCRGDGGFNGCCSGASIGDGGFTLVCSSGCRGVVGFNVATSQRPVREKVRPARSDRGCEREKVRPAHERWPTIGVLWRAGRTFSRVSGGEGVPGESCRAYRHGSQVSQVTWCPTCRKWWGFALHEALWPRVAGVSEPHVVQFPRVVSGVVCVLAEVLAAGPFDWQC